MFDKYLKTFDYQERKDMKIQLPEFFDLYAKGEAQLIDIRFMPLLILLGFDAKKAAYAISFVIPFSTLGAFATYISFVNMDWVLLGVVSVAAIIGGYLGVPFDTQTSQKAYCLKPRPSMQLKLSYHDFSLAESEDVWSYYLGILWCTMLQTTMHRDFSYRWSIDSIDN